MLGNDIKAGIEPFHLDEKLIWRPFFHFLAGCYKITTVFSHAQTVVLCVSCSTVLAQPTGGRARLTEGKYTCMYLVDIIIG